MPHFKELTVDNIYKLVDSNPETIKCLPDKKDPPHKQLPRQFVMDVVNTLYPEFIQTLVADVV